MIADHSVSRNDAVRTVQFYLLVGNFVYQRHSGNRNSRAGLAHDAGFIPQDNAGSWSDRLDHQSV